MTLPMCEDATSLDLGSHQNYAIRLKQLQSLSSTVPTLSSNSSSSNSFSTIPKLTDILNDNVDPENIYSKPQFLKFLLEKHCFENYDLLTHIKSLKLNYDTLKRRNSINIWAAIYDQFFETDIVNLPADLTQNLSKSKLPNLKILNSIEKTLLNFLRDSYYEFLSLNKPLLIKNNNTQIKNSNLTTHSTSTSAETCFTKSNYISDSNSISSDDSNIINELNDLLIKEKLTENIDDSDVFQYENEVLIEENVLEDSADDESNEKLISNILDDLTIDSNQSLDSNKTTLVNKLSPTKTQQIEITKTSKSWSKLTNKLKWMRRSSH